MYRQFSTLSPNSPFFNFQATLINGQKVEKLGDLVQDKKAILVVNVASEWGVTVRDYTQLVQMHEDLSPQGLEILAYPCNQFGDQEPHSPEWIEDFVKQFNVKFPIMSKIAVFNKR